MAHFLSTVQPDIMLVSETKINSDIKPQEFLPGNYSGHIRHDHSLFAGGVMIINKKDLVIEEIELEKHPHHDHIVWARSSLQNKSPLYIGAYCRSNSSNTADTISGLKSSLEHITSLTKNNPKCTIVPRVEPRPPKINCSRCRAVLGA